MSDTALAPIERERTGRALIVAETLTQEAEQRRLLGLYVEQQMIPDTDYGVIPGTKNKTLLKPGAEKLTALFRCVPQFELLREESDWEKGFFYYRFKCRIVTLADGVTVAEGVGSCSSYESRYRWRKGERLCPECGKPCIIKGKAEYGGGWLCYGKKGGCGAKFADGDQAIESQTTDRVQNPDLADVDNTVLKMAKKRAHVDAAISLARCSDMFTQDLDDEPGERSEPGPKQQPQQRPAWTKEAIEELLSRKGWDTTMAARAIDKKHRTHYLANKTPLSQIPELPAMLEWLKTEPDKPQTQSPPPPAPAEEVPDAEFSIPEDEQGSDPSRNAHSAASQSATAASAESKNNPDDPVHSEKAFIKLAQTKGVTLSQGLSRINVEFRTGFGGMIQWNAIPQGYREWLVKEVRSMPDAGKGAA